MNILRSITAWYPAFHQGGEPRAVECSLSLMEGNGKKYLKTPFALLNAYADDAPERQIIVGNYYATQADCEAYLANQYPWWQQAAPIMNAIMSALRHSSFGASHVADRVLVSPDDVHSLARGHKRWNLKVIRAAVKRLAESRSPLTV